MISGLTRESKIGFIGGGAVGQTLAVALAAKGYPVVAAASRTHASAESLAGRVEGCAALREPQQVADAADFLLITTFDDAIGPVADAIRWRGGQGVAHCSGAASLDVLQGAEEQGAAVGTLHPLQAFVSVDEALRNLPGSTFGIEGDGPIREYLRDMALALDGRPMFLRPEDKPLYHGSIIMLGNLLLGLTGFVADLWQKLGIEREDALKSLLPIVQGCVDSMNANGFPGAFAGPYARGDAGTIDKHIQTFTSRAPEALHLYCQMALASLPMALEKGRADPSTLRWIETMLKETIAAHSQSRPG